MAASAGGLTRRILGSLALAVAGFGVAYRVVLALAPGAVLPAVAAGSAIALTLAGLVLWRTVAPLVATQADLQVRYEAALADALRDPLTGLGNHRAFHEELDRQVAGALRYGVPLALLLIDLDEFKAVNDGRGHAGGDRVLRGFGELLGMTLRRADRAFRVGGDEFAVLLPHTDLEGARVVARRLLAQALQPSLRADSFEPLSFSGGISAVPELGIGPAQLYSQADAALYAAKRGGRTDVLAFDPDMERTAGFDTSSSAVADVIARGQLRPVYQPIVSLADDRIIGVEGLIRPVAPAPFATPADLFAAAEAGGRLTALDLACIDTIVAGARDLSADRFLSLNLSPATLEATEFSSGALLGILARHGFPPGRLIVELTERQQLHDLDRARSRIAACRAQGVRFAADDIGAGNAGLRLLAEIEFDMLKVDLSLVQRSASEGPSSAVLESVVGLASRTDALVVAEGIEHASQLPPLISLGVTAGQGYHLGRPAPMVTELEGGRVPELAAAAGGGASAWRQAMGLPSIT
jgi:diguanylate cyclase (GGDEF)-like protein